MDDTSVATEIRARLTADPSNFVQGVHQAQSAAEGLMGQANEMSKALTMAGTVIGAIGAAFVGFSVKAFEAAGQVQTMDVAMQAVGRSTGIGYQALKQATEAMTQVGIQTDVAQSSVLKFAH